MSAAPGAPALFAYDELAYPSPVIPTQTPDRIAAAARLHGYDAPDPLDCSVLELGCGDGLNLTAIAAFAPRSRCVGFDLSEAAITRGRALVDAAGLGNIELHAGDIVTWPRAGERFDYIAAHGVFAWVPPFVRNAIFELIATRLAPGGIAYVSFDCAPATLPKAAINRFLVDHIGPAHGTLREAQAAMDMIGMLSRHQRPDSVYAATLAQLAETKSIEEPGYLVHDILEPFYQPVSVTAFAAAAARHGLALIGDAGLIDLYLGDLDAAARSALAARPDYPSRAALIDMMHGDTTFRRALLVRSDAPPAAARDPFENLRFGFLGNRVESEGETAFEAGGTARLNRPAGDLGRLIACFAGHAPAELTLDEARAATGIARDAAIDAVRDLAAAGLLEAYGTPQPFTITPGERPVAGILVRTMFARTDHAINLRHLRVTAGEATRYFVTLCDGTRTRSDLAAAMTEYAGTKVGVERIDDTVGQLAAQAVFVA